VADRFVIRVTEPFSPRRAQMAFGDASATACLLSFPAIFKEYSMATKLVVPALCSLVLVAGHVGAVAPAQVLGVRLEDSTTDSTIANVRITLDHATLAPGRVTFEAVNESKALTHEVVVVRDRGTGELPFDAQHDRVNEHAVRRLGEIADLAPGGAGKLTLNLGPGTYLLLCNESGRYKDGMATKLVVAP
jgi:uncharacterized cupredoxin-like copper-binding protein